MRGSGAERQSGKASWTKWPGRVSRADQRGRVGWVRGAVSGPQVLGSSGRSGRKGTRSYGAVELTGRRLTWVQRMCWTELGPHGPDSKLFLHPLSAPLCGYVTATEAAGICQPLTHLLPLLGDGDRLQRHPGLWPQPGLRGHQ